MSKAKGSRKSRNPVEKLQSQISQLQNVCDAILDSAENPDFAQSIIELRKKKESEQSNKSKLGKEAREAVKLLRKYPGLSKQFLSSIRSKISEYRSLNVLDKYKTESEMSVNTDMEAAVAR
jgi:hypothetical protein